MKLIYHIDTGTYFSLNDTVVILDTDTIPQERLHDLYEAGDPTVAYDYGEQLMGVVHGAHHEEYN